MTLDALAEHRQRGPDLARIRGQPPQTPPPLRLIRLIRLPLFDK